jgi:hypothetical protein
MIEILTANIGLISYATVGVIYAKLEDSCFEIDFSECSWGQMMMFQLQMMIHYARIVAVWPTYMVEDFLVYLTNRGEDFDEEDDDAGDY